MDDPIPQQAQAVQKKVLPGIVVEYLEGKDLVSHPP